MSIRPTIAQLQRELGDAGFDCGTVDGLWGPKTEAALEACIAAERRGTGTDRFTLGQRDQERLQGINTELVRVVMRAAEIGDVPFMVIEGLRSEARQRELVARGASRTMRSYHLTGHAVDLAPLDGDACSWAWPLYHDLAAVVKRAATECGVAIEWGGDWRTFKDGPHWQIPR